MIEITDPQQPAKAGERDPLPKSILLHLLPGAVQVVAFVLLAPLVMRSGYPAGLFFPPA